MRMAALVCRRSPSHLSVVDTLHWRAWHTLPVSPAAVRHMLGVLKLELVSESNVKRDGHVFHHAAAPGAQRVVRKRSVASMENARRRALLK